MSEAKGLRRNIGRSEEQLDVKLNHRTAKQVFAGLLLIVDDASEERHGIRKEVKLFD
jgi:hypothetical protein